MGGVKGSGPWGGSGPVPPDAGLLPTPRKVGEALCLTRAWGRGASVSQEVAVGKGRFPGVEGGVARSAPRKGPAGEAGGGPRRAPAALPEVDRGKGPEERGAALTGHGDGSGSDLPPLRPFVHSDVAGPAPFSPRNGVVLSSPPLRARRRLPLGRKKHVGPRATLEPGPARGGVGRPGARGAGLRSGAAGRAGESRPVTWAGGEGRGRRCGASAGSGT